MDGQWIQDYETDIAGTPCERVIDSADIVHFPDNLFKLFPDDPDITAINAVSYRRQDCRALRLLRMHIRQSQIIERSLRAGGELFCAQAG
jgi:hypothetical protein